MADVSRRMTCDIVVRQRWLETAHSLNAMRRNRLATKHVRAKKIIRARASQFRRDKATDVKAAQSNPSHPQWHWCRRAMMRNTLENEVHRRANAAASEASAGARRPEDATSKTRNVMVCDHKKRQRTGVIGRESGDDAENGVVGLRNFHLSGGSCRSGLLTLMALWS